MNLSRRCSHFEMPDFFVVYKLSQWLRLSCLWGVALGSPVRYRERPAPATDLQGNIPLGNARGPHRECVRSVRVQLGTGMQHMAAHFSSQPCSSYPRRLSFPSPPQKALTGHWACQRRRQSRGASEMQFSSLADCVLIFPPNVSPECDLRCLLAEPQS